MTLPTWFTNDSPARNLHPNAHNDTNAAFNILDTTVAGLTVDVAAVSAGTFPVSRYGAVGNGTTDDGPAIQAAMDAAAVAGGTVLFDPGKIYQLIAAPLVLKRQVRLLGPSGHGISGATIRSSTVDIFTVAATLWGVVVDGLFLQSNAGGGHIFNLGPTYMSSGGVVQNCTLNQFNDAKSAVSCAYGMLEWRWQDLIVNHTTTATVPTFHLVSPALSLSLNTFDSIRFTYSGDYNIHIESPSASGYCQDNLIRNINFEVCHGGQVRLLSCRNTTIDGCVDYDATAHTKSRIYIGKSTLGPSSINNTVRNCARRGSPTMTGVYDIQCQNSGRTTVMGCNGLINLGYTSGNVIMSLDSSTPAAVLSSILSNTIIMVNGEIRMGAFTTAGRPVATTYGAGTMVYDSTLSKPVFSDGTVWRDATGTAV